MLSPAYVASRYISVLGNVNLENITLCSRNVGETGYTTYTWAARELPADQMLSAGETVSSERHKTIQLIKATQTVDPKEGDYIQLTLGLNTGALVKYLINRMDIGYNRFVFTCHTTLMV